MLLIIGLLAGVIIGLIRGGSLYRLGELRGIWMAVCAVCMDVFLRHAPGIAIWPKGLLTSGCYLCVLLFVFANRKSAAATATLGAGTVCNYAVKAANAFRMPVSVKALSVFAGISDAAVRAQRPDYFIAENGANLLPLGDVIYIPLPWQKAFYSIGDFLIAAGVFLLVTAAMGKREPSETPEASGADFEQIDPETAGQGCADLSPAAEDAPAAQDAGGNADGADKTE